MKVRVLDFTGGEPFLHRQLPEFLEIAKSLGFVTTVTTNTLLYPKYGKQLKGLVDMLHFSLDSIDADKHNASRKVDCFDHLIRSVELAREWGERPDILFTVTTENIHEIHQLYHQFVLERELIVILNPVFSYNKVGENLPISDIKILSEWGKKPGIYLNQAFLNLRIAGGNHIEAPICIAGSSTVVISAYNELVLPCYHLGKKSFPIHGELESVYNSREAKKMIAQEGRLPECEGCVVNCYMEPSMSMQTNSYFYTSLRSTLKYSLEKWIYI